MEEKGEKGEINMKKIAIVTDSNSGITAQARAAAVTQDPERPLDMGI